MPQDDAEVREVDISISGAGVGTLQVNEVTFTNAVNALPSCVIKGARAGGDEANLMTAKKGAVKFSLEATSEQLSMDQNEMFNPDGERELTIKVNDDGMGNKMEIVGLSSSPGLSVNAGKIVEQRTIVHPDQRMAGLNMSIYDLVNEEGNHSAKPVDTCDPNKALPVATHIQKIIEWILSAEFEISGQSNGTHKYLIDTDAKNNDVWSKIVKPIIEGSTDTKLEFETFGAKIGNGEYTDHISNNIQAQSNYLNTHLQIFMPSFLFQHSCGFDLKESESRFMHSQTNASSASKYYVKANVDLISMNYGMGATGELPLGQVILTGTTMSEYGNQTKNGHGQGNNPGEISRKIPVASGHPEKKTPGLGETKFITMPKWMEHHYCPVPPTQQPPGPAGQPQGRDVDGDVQDAVDNNKQRVEAQMGTGLKGTMTLLQAWAMKHYCQQGLQNHTCMIQIPLDIRWGCARGPLPKGSLSDGSDAKYGQKGGRPCGWVYKISATNYKEGGDPIFLFEGYLRSVSHDIGVGPKQGRAITHLTFSHVKGVVWDKTKFVPPYTCPPWVD